MIMKSINIINHNKDWSRGWGLSCYRNWNRSDRCRICRLGMAYSWNYLWCSISGLKNDFKQSSLRYCKY